MAVTPIGCRLHNAQRPAALVPTHGSDSAHNQDHSSVERGARDRTDRIKIATPIRAQFTVVGLLTAVGTNVRYRAVEASPIIVENASTPNPTTVVTTAQA